MAITIKNNGNPIIEVLKTHGLHTSPFKVLSEDKIYVSMKTLKEAPVLAQSSSPFAGNGVYVNLTKPKYTPQYLDTLTGDPTVVTTIVPKTITIKKVDVEPYDSIWSFTDGQQEIAEKVAKPIPEAQPKAKMPKKPKKEPTVDFKHIPHLYPNPVVECVIKHKKNAEFHFLLHKQEDDLFWGICDVLFTGKNHSILSGQDSATALQFFKGSFCEQCKKGLKSKPDFKHIYEQWFKF